MCHLAASAPLTERGTCFSSGRSAAYGLMRSWDGKGVRLLKTSWYVEGLNLIGVVAGGPESWPVVGGPGTVLPWPGGGVVGGGSGGAVWGCVDVLSAL